MQFWNTIIHTALLGTDKKQLLAEEFTPPLSVVAQQLMQQPGSKEDHFLQMAAVALNYRQAGVAATKELVEMPKAAPETMAYCPDAARQVLKDILAEESIPLLAHWLEQCRQHNKIATPDFLPVLLQSGVTHKTLQPLIIDCGGQRAVWLSTFNSAWKFSAEHSNEELWQTGTPDERRRVIRQLRTEEPALALQWIQQSWPQEDAATKTDYIRVLATAAGENDIPFLESLSAEKSKKVRDEALWLLKKIPAAAIVQQYWTMLKQMVLVKKEKALLGMMNKTSLQLMMPANANDPVFSTGVDKLSNNKEFSDEVFIAYQLLQHIPLSWLEEEWQLKPDEIIHLFQKDASAKKLLPAMVLSAVNFNDGRWAVFFMQHAAIFYTDILPLLPVQQQEFYSIKFFNDRPEDIIQYAVKRSSEWSRELAGLICRHIAKNPYQYNRSFFNQHIRLLPAVIATDLEKFTPPEENLRVMWSNTSDYILKLLSLKAQTINAFN